MPADEECANISPARPTEIEDSGEIRRQFHKTSHATEDLIVKHIEKGNKGSRLYG